MTSAEQDRRYMERALALAENARGFAEPNPVVGAVVVSDGRIVGEGYTQPFGGDHAEVVGLEKAGERARGADIYVTLEPCAHYGKTPPCAEALVRAQPRRVIIPVLDPTQKTRGKGVARLRENGIAVEVGLCREEAVRSNAGFFKLAAVGRPLVIAKWAMSADGKIATRGGDSRWITGPQARELVHRHRGRVDAVMVGARTAQADDPLLTCRDSERRRTAARIVVCGADVPAAGSKLVRSVREGPVLLAHRADDPPEGLDQAEAAGCEAMALPGDRSGVNLCALLDELGRRSMTNVLVEGGGELLGSLFDGRLVDRAMVFVAPIVLGGRGALTAVAGEGVASMADAIPLKSRTVSAHGPDILVEGWVVDALEWQPDEPTPEEHLYE